jgi:membrane-bound lytic murein transglycosylase D
MKAFLFIFLITLFSLLTSCDQLLSKPDATLLPKTTQLDYKDLQVLTVPPSALPTQEKRQSTSLRKETHVTSPTSSEGEILTPLFTSPKQTEISTVEKQSSLKTSALYAFSKEEVNETLSITPHLFNFKPYTLPKPTKPKQAAQAETVKENKPKQDIQAETAKENKSKQDIQAKIAEENKSKTNKTEQTITPETEKKKPESPPKKEIGKSKPSPKPVESELITQVTYKGCQNEQTDLWCRMRMGYKFQVEDNEAIQEAVAYFAEAQTFFDKVARRARPYLYYVVREIEAQDLPLELALVPVIESAYRTTAVSPKAAAGLWQFIPSTGEQFGLTQNEWYDARYDVVASTRAALKYLKSLHRRFKSDWFLALAAYNWGQGNISKAIEKNAAEGKPTDFWSLELPTETRQYVPRLIAVAEIIAHPQDYGISLKSIASRPYFKQVEIDHPISLEIAADLAGMSIEDFKYYNPTHLQDTTALTGSQRFTLPINYADQFKKNIAGRSTVDLIPTPVTTEETPIESSEDEMTAEETTAKTDTSNLETLAINEVETAVEKTVSVKDVFQLSADKSVAEVTHYYKVKSGDTLWHIAKRHKMKLSKLQQLNGFDGRHLKVGQNIKIGGSPQQAIKTVKAFLLPSQHPIETQQYRVQKKETLWKIAKRYKTTVPLLRALNNLQGQSLKIGTTLKIPVPLPEKEEETVVAEVAENTEAQPSEISTDKEKVTEDSAESIAEETVQESTKKKVIHTVKSGESLWLIARQYRVKIDELAEWNSLQKREALKSGQKLTVWQGG